MNNEPKATKKNELEEIEPMQTFNNHEETREDPAPPPDIVIEN